MMLRYKWIWITLLSVIAFAVMILTVYFIFFRSYGSMMLAGKALINLGHEVEERFDHTPLKAITMLPGILEDGTVTADVTYTTSIFGTFLTADINGTAILSSDLKARNFALEAQAGIFGQSIGIDAYMNKERLALRLPIIDESFYGIRYDTFRDDIRVFGRLIMLNDLLMDTLADYVDQLNSILNTKEINDDVPSVFTDAFVNFASSLKVTEKRAKIHYNGEPVNCSLVGIKIPKEAIIKLLNNLYDVFENNGSLQGTMLDLFENALLQDIFIDHDNDYGLFLRDFKNGIKEFEELYSGEIELLFYISKEDRLLRLEVDVDIKYDSNPLKLDLEFSFGNSINDEWVLDAIFIINQSSGRFIAEWIYEERSGTYTNTITVTEGKTTSIALISEWDLNRGDFTLSYTNYPDTNTISGVLITDDKNFNLLFDDLYQDDPYNSLKIEISTKTGAQINEIYYVNIDQWSSAIFESMIGLIFGIIFF